MPTNRDIILDNVRRNLHVRVGSWVHLAKPDDASAGRQGTEEIVRQVAGRSDSELWEMFSARIGELGDTAFRFDNAAALKKWLLEDIHHSENCAGVADDDAVRFLSIADDEKASIGLRESMPRAELLRCQYGITMVDWAVAETGSIAVVCGEKRDRMNSLAPETHYAILPAGRLVADLVDGLHEQSRHRQSRCIVWITGSSRTADIEGVLVHGAHGPRRLCVLGLIR